jgi:membrane protein involved in colicin uptake
MKPRISALVATVLFSTGLGAQTPAPAAQPSIGALTPQMEYVRLLVTHIQRNWYAPKDSGGQKCTVLVTQSEEGDVISAESSDCPSKEVAESVESAVIRASPLPLPRDASVFSPKLLLTFIVPGDE